MGTVPGPVPAGRGPARRVLKRAVGFSPKTPRSGRQWKKYQANLASETAILTATGRKLQRGLRRSTGAEAALKKRGRHFRELLRDSLQLQAGLRQLTREHFSAQELDRLTISRHLQNEIAQTLLGINIRLLDLKTAARTNRRKLTKQIASTQRLVEQSLRSINRFVRELDLPQCDITGPDLSLPATS